MFVSAQTGGCGTKRSADSMDLPRPASRPVVTPFAECSALANADIGSAVGAPVHIASASLVLDAKPAAPNCRVPGHVEPSVRFEARLPSTTWSQRFVSVAQLRALRIRHDRRSSQGDSKSVSIIGVEI